MLKGGCCSTQAQEISLNFHCKCEQFVHFATGSFFNFNGTAGAWPSCALLATQEVYVSTTALCLAVGGWVQAGDAEDSLLKPSCA